MKFWKPSVERDAFSVPRSVQKSIPIKRVYKDGIFEVGGKFSKTWRFFDVNYKVASPEKQEDLFKAYCAFLNALPVNATAKITLFNRRLNQREFKTEAYKSGVRMDELYEKAMAAFKRYSGQEEEEEDGY